MTPLLLLLLAAVVSASGNTTAVCVADLAAVPAGAANASLRALTLRPVGCYPAASPFGAPAGHDPCGIPTSAEAAALEARSAPVPPGHKADAATCAGACAVWQRLHNGTALYPALWGRRCVCLSALEVARAQTHPPTGPSCCAVNGTHPALHVYEASLLCPPLPSAAGCGLPCGERAGGCCGPVDNGSSLGAGVWVGIAALCIVVVGVVEVAVVKIVMARCRRPPSTPEPAALDVPLVAVGGGDDAGLEPFTRLRPLGEAEGAAAALVQPFARRGPPRHSGDDADCPVCLDRLGSGGDIADLRCGHAFHAACARSYAAHTLRRGREPLCPVCQLPVAPACEALPPPGHRR